MRVCTWFQTRRWYRWNCGRGGKNWNVWGEKLERFLLETILAREDETMVTAKLLTLRRIKATSRLRGGTRNTRKPVASSAHEGCVVFANGSTLPILICVNTLDAFISEESIKAFLVLRNVFDVCHAYFRTKINAGRTISFFFFKFCETEVYYFSLRSKKKSLISLNAVHTTQKFSTRWNYAKDNFSFENWNLGRERSIQRRSFVVRESCIAVRLSSPLTRFGPISGRVTVAEIRVEIISTSREETREVFGSTFGLVTPVSARACVRSVDKLLEMELVFLSGERKLPSKGSDMDIAYSE